MKVNGFGIMSEKAGRMDVQKVDHIMPFAPAVDHALNDFLIFFGKHNRLAAKESAVRNSLQAV